ncbi:FAD/NAD(P)-binding protein [Saccharopolyspora rosea]|uniref:FAD/NAD(P)-binding protein n=1 Tax=Saccharopolyspora rosea TaxID=524884 RepID=A0ABW3FS61_9PSEU
MTAVVVVGAGPRATGLLERLAANAPELLPEQSLTVHLVDPHPPGAGRVWRADQSRLLWMNSMAEDVTMFLDSTVDCDGPVLGGPSLAEWARDARDRERAGLPGPLDDLPPDVAAEVRALHGRSFPSRRAQHAYLAWVHQRVLDRLPGNITVRWHRAAAVGLDDLADGRQRVRLDDDGSLTADVVVLALGHTDADPAGEHARLGRHARAVGAHHVPPGYTDAVDLARLRPGEDVVMRGFGLAFVDLMVLLTEGRGGRYRTEPDGTLTYLPSGAEPVLHVGSRRGVPYRAKPGYGLRGPRPRFPEFFGPHQIDALPAGADFRADVLPLIEKELGWGYYHELFHGHPRRVALPWREFAARFAADDPAVVAEAVPNPADRLDLAALDRPMAGVRCADAEALQDWVRGHITADLARRADPHHSADLGAFFALLSVYGQLGRLLRSGKLSARSQVEDLDGWWFGFFNYYASGPPPERLRQLLALSRAGVVRFLGADLRVTPDEDGFVATSASAPHRVHARTLVEAQLPHPSLRRTRNPLLRRLHRDGAVLEEELPGARRTGRLVVSDDAEVVDATGRPHPRRYALGVHTSARSAAAFARPRTNAAPFRLNDAVARRILRTLAANTAHQRCGAAAG